MTPPARLRTSRTALLPIGALVVCMLPVAATSPWAALILLVPLALTAWVLRTGVDVTDDGLTARTLFGSRRVAWAEVAGIRVAERGELWLVTARRTEVRLPALRFRDLPRLSALSGGRFELPAPPGQ